MGCKVIMKNQIVDKISLYSINGSFLCSEHRWAQLLKQHTSIIVYRLPTKENKLLSSVFHIYLYLEIEIYIYIYIYIYAAVSNVKWKTKAQMIFLICLPFAHHAYGGLSFVCLLRRNIWQLSVCKWIKWTKQTCPSMGDAYQ